MRFEPGAVVAERYEIIDVKRGGMAEVAICRDTAGTDTDLVAIKRVSHELHDNAEARWRFDREASAWMSIGRAPWGFVLPLNQVLSDTGGRMIVMPHCSGGSLRDRLENGALARVEAAEVATELLLGLHVLHVQNGLVHRDLKPSNILFNHENRIQIADLGVVKFNGDDVGQTLRAVGRDGHTQFGQFVGTCAYAAPEQILGVQSVDWRADAWSFGIVVHEMFTGRRPFPDADIEQHLKEILRTTPTPLAELEERSNRDVAAVVARCLRPNPDDRFSSFGQLIAAWDKAIRTTSTPALEISERDERIILDERSLADAPWTGILFPHRICEDQRVITWDMSAAAGISEARDFYRLDRYQEAITAAQKTLGSPDDAESNLALLFRGELPDKSLMRHVDASSGLRSAIVPSREMAVEALCWSMRAHVALIEARDDRADWTARLSELGRRIISAGLDDVSLLILVTQAFMLAGDYEDSLRIGHALLRAAPLDVPAGWVTFQATRRSGDLETAAKLAHRLIEGYLVQEDSMHYRWALKLAYCIDDWATVVRLSPEGLRRMPDDYELLAMLTTALVNVRRKEDARRYYDRMRATAPDAEFTKQLSPEFALP